MNLRHQFARIASFVYRTHLLTVLYTLEFALASNLLAYLAVTRNGIESHDLSGILLASFLGMIGGILFLMMQYRMDELAGQVDKMQQPGNPFIGDAFYLGVRLLAGIWVLLSKSFVLLSLSLGG